MPCPNAPTAQFAPHQQKRPTAFFRFLASLTHRTLLRVAQAEAYATETRMNGAIAPSSFAGHGMSKIPRRFAGPCPY
jgi:hypothetical protein